ncbi:phosphohistidine phosphatase [Spinactinospora alkalitolerans]|uniref:Phosphohistidine phosphatase n=1 Tax=Spinactinospora alkalitolerans TaxID=687207 RepID=A0A852TNC0_9ACTN|nr:histidine phosphatase family protein [Spinactinospora alkalitolerans]NYE44921.1 phosphohistidine phosphatase [Spinactinospora alkalitolerans]
MSGRLIILRHAQADPGIGTSDADRELTGKGRVQAAAVGRLLAGEGLVPDHVICSTARRTRQTWELVAAGLPGEPTVDFEPAAYSAGLDAMFELIGLVGADVGTLMVVGHNPTAAQLAAAFIGGVVAFPPASIAVADLDVEWLYAAPGTGTGRILT